MTDTVSTATSDVMPLIVVLEERMTGDFDDATGCYRDYPDPTCQQAAATLRAMAKELDQLRLMVTCCPREVSHD